eukprot:5542005-Amphidinium_carterae.1
MPAPQGNANTSRKCAQQLAQEGEKNPWGDPKDLVSCLREQVVSQMLAMCPIAQLTNSSMQFIAHLGWQTSAALRRSSVHVANTFINEVGHRWQRCYLACAWKQTTSHKEPVLAASSTDAAPALAPASLALRL